MALVTGSVPQTAEAPPASAGQRRGARFWFGECAGALGDIGTFVPLAVGMVQIAGLDGGAILVTAGVVNILSGLAFGIPIAVQPMKAIGALAIGGALSGPQAVMAGACVGVSMILLGAFRLTDPLARAVPGAVIRALQFTVAAELLLRGLRFAFAAQGGAAAGDSGPVLIRLLMVCALAALWLMRRRLEWAAVVLLAAGMAIEAWQHPALRVMPEVTLWHPRWMTFDRAAIAGIWLGGLPQIPLTFLNSVLAVTALARQLFPRQAPRLGADRFALSVGFMNLVIAPFGAMPLCHGSGGLAGQYRLGARTGFSVVLLGSAKMILGLLFSAAAVAWMHAFPRQILGIFLLLAGWSLAGASRVWKTRRGVWVALVMAGAFFATGLLLVAFAAGWLTCWIHEIAERRRVSSREAE